MEFEWLCLFCAKNSIIFENKKGGVWRMIIESKPSKKRLNSIIQ
jgi:hypothetical protein